jgi:hypothetical protein
MCELIPITTTAITLASQTSDAAMSQIPMIAVFISTPPRSRP